MGNKIIYGQISQGFIEKHKNKIANASNEIEDLIEQVPGKPLFIQLEILSKLEKLHNDIRYSQNALKIAEKVNSIKVFKNGSLTKFHHQYQLEAVCG